MNRVRMKLAGSIALVISIVGVLLAIGGQMNFLGNSRPETIATSSKIKTNTAKPKYSFYDDLKKRKTKVELAKTQPQIKPIITKVKNDSFSYVIQVGAFSKKNDASIIEAKMQKLGYGVRIVKKSKKFLVQTSPIHGKARAFSIESRLKKQNFPTLVKRLK